VSAILTSRGVSYPCLAWFLSRQCIPCQNRVHPYACEGVAGSCDLSPWRNSLLNLTPILQSPSNRELEYLREIVCAPHRPRIGRDRAAAVVLPRQLRDAVCSDAEIAEPGGQAVCFLTADDRHGLCLRRFAGSKCHAHGGGHSIWFALKLDSRSPIKALEDKLLGNDNSAVRAGPC